jgi:flavin reductase (DIM6/NTAB) family NADH-FMN oxidoreductase RutF
VEYHIEQLDFSISYKLMTNLITPRPIAWITSMDGSGVVNAAPFSFFNMLGAEPPLLAVGIGHRPGTDTPKDTALNIRSTGEFVVNLVSEELVEKMNESSIDFPHGISELEKTGLTTAPGRQIKTPRIAESPASFECRLVQHSVIGSNLIFIGQIVHLWVADELIDTQKLHIRAELFHPVGRMGAPATYVRARDRFNMPRLNYQQWIEKQASAQGLDHQ